MIVRRRRRFAMEGALGSLDLVSIVFVAASLGLGLVK